MSEDIDRLLGIGETFHLGSHVFAADEIVDFASKYDPQPFHLSQEKAEASVFGALCASGWHTGSTWMRYYVAHLPKLIERSKALGGTGEFGPAAGFRQLKWLKPVYVGDTISFSFTPESHRPIASRPGWRMLTSHCAAANQNGATVMSFTTMVLMKP